MRRKHQDDAELDERARKLYLNSKKVLGPQPARKIIPCPRCGGQALLEIVDKQWMYVCFSCSEETPVQGE